MRDSQRPFCNRHEAPGTQTASVEPSTSCASGRSRERQPGLPYRLRLAPCGTSARRLRARTSPSDGDTRLPHTSSQPSASPGRGDAGRGTCPWAAAGSGVEQPHLGPPRRRRPAFVVVQASRRRLHGPCSGRIAGLVADAHRPPDGFAGQWWSAAGSGGRLNRRTSCEHARGTRIWRRAGASRRAGQDPHSCLREHGRPIRRGDRLRPIGPSWRQLNSETGSVLPRPSHDPTGRSGPARAAGEPNAHGRP
jgi:hypothetical protein